MSLLTIIQDAMVLCKQARPNSVMNSSDATVRQFVAHCQEAGDAESHHGWRGLKVSADLTGDGTSTEYTLPADYAYMMQGNKIWITDWFNRPLKKVTDEQMMAAQIAGLAPLQPIWRFFGESIEFYPAIETGRVCKLEYRSSHWILNADRTIRRTAWEIDDDISAIPERLIKLSTVWRWKQSVGVSYDEDFRNWQIASSQLKFNDVSAEPIRVGRGVINDGLARGVLGDVPPISA